MAKNSKKRKVAAEKVDPNNHYGLLEAMTLVKEINQTSFDAAVDIHIRLGIDPRKADQALRGTVKLPHGTGKSKSVLVLCKPEKEKEAEAAGADYFGLDDYVQKIQQGWTDVDVIIATPDVMPTVGKIGRILGPRGLMPNPKTGTVTSDVAAAIEDVKGGKIAFRVDKYGIIHSSIGRVSFAPDKLTENANELITTVVKMKPPSAKGIYMKSLTVATTMSLGIKIETKDY